MSVDQPESDDWGNNEVVVLLDESGHFTGVADKHQVHGRDTPLHLAFSCYIFAPDGRFMLTQRATTKKTWPGVWTNSCCGHPGPGEYLNTAVRRRVKQELGITINDLMLVLPDFRYRAVMDDGMVEHEMCPVFRAISCSPPSPDPVEVERISWVEWNAFCQEVLSGHRDISPWCVQQVSELVGLGPEPLAWPVGNRELLPPAARGGDERGG